MPERSGADVPELYLVCNISQLCIKQTGPRSEFLLGYALPILCKGLVQI